MLVVLEEVKKHNHLKSTAFLKIALQHRQIASLLEMPNQENGWDSLNSNNGRSGSPATDIAGGCGGWFGGLSSQHYNETVFFSIKSFGKFVFSLGF